MTNFIRALLSKITRRGEDGQAVVELALLMPIMLLLVFGVAELTQAYSVAITIGASTREGARIAGALANGGLPLGCGGTNSPNAATVDPQIIAAVERVLTASGTGTTLADVTEIRIYKSDVNGNEVSGIVNQFTYSANGGTIVDGQPLDFVAATNGWPACNRSNVNPADPIGVSVRYTYRGRTPLRWLIPALSTIPILDHAVMDLNASR
jgi:Flp pilus assembly protein TadG